MGGSWFGGIVLYVKDGKVHFEYRYCESTSHAISAALPSGRSKLEVCLHFERTGKLSGVAHLSVDAAAPSSLPIPQTWPVNVLTAGLRCGLDGPAPVSDSYQAPFAFTGSDLRVVFEVEPGAGNGDARAFKAALKEQ